MIYILILLEAKQHGTILHMIDIISKLGLYYVK